jgi:hypothetical protein
LRTLEAVGALLLAYGMVRAVPVTILRRLAGSVRPTNGMRATDRAPADPCSMAVARALASGVRRLPWSSTCLMNAVAGQLMLVRRGRRGEIVLGVSTRDGALRAHAWLVAGDGTVCGGSEAADYSPIAIVAGSGRSRS